MLKLSLLNCPAKFFLAATTLSVLTAVGCGTNSNGPAPGNPVPGQNSDVSVLLSSSSNDQLVKYQMFLHSLTLTSESGNTVHILSSPQEADFISLNGSPEPLLEVSIPQGVYTSAQASIGYTEFSCVMFSQSIKTENYSYGYVPDKFVTVNLSGPITVAGPSMMLNLNLMTADSAKWPLPCGQAVTTADFSITPTFDLSYLSASSFSGEMTGLQGTVASLDQLASSLTVIAADGPKAEPFTNTVTTGIHWVVRVNQETTFGGVNGLADIAVGAAVDFDGNIQSDGSILASRITVLDNDPTDLSLAVGPIEEVMNSEPVVVQATRESEGPLVSGTADLISPEMNFDYSNAKFKIWAGLENLQKLPFSATFGLDNVVAGQNVLITSHTPSMPNAPENPAASTITLVPQTIDGTVRDMTTSGGFEVYTVALASYDLFPELAFSNSYQTSPLTDPSTVMVYVDSSTKTLNSPSATVGAVLRFTGVVFDDNGALRMDCARIRNGVAE